MNTCEAFLNAYRDLEEVLSQKYGHRPGTVQSFAAEDGAKYYEELTVFREMRNLLSHHGKIDGEPPVLPSEASLNKLLEILEYAKNPPVALNIATPREKLYCASGDNDIIQITSIMEKMGYSHIPILNKNGSLFGVFSVGTLFSYMKANATKAIKGLKVSDFSEFTPAHKHTTEKFMFVNKDASAAELKKMFTIKGPYRRRVVAVFVTSDGTQNGKLLGMITPWDVFKTE